MKRQEASHQNSEIIKKLFKEEKTKTAELDSSMQCNSHDCRRGNGVNKKKNKYKIQAAVSYFRGVKVYLLRRRKLKGMVD